VVGGLFVAMVSAGLVVSTRFAEAATTARAGDVFAVVARGGSGKTEVHSLSRTNGYRTFSVQVATGLGATSLATWTYGIGDYDGDRSPDLFAVNSRDNGGANTAVHVFSGASNFATAILHKRLPSMGATDLARWQFFVGDYNGDRRADLYAVDSRDNAGANTAVHVFNAANGMSSYLLHKRLPDMGATNLDVWTFSAGDYNGDRRADLFAVNTRDNGGANTAAHVFNAVDGMDSFLLHKRLPSMGSAALTQWWFSTGDHNQDGRADLVAVNGNDAGSGKTAVHVLDGKAGLNVYLAHSVSPLNPTSHSIWQFHGWPGPTSGGTLPPTGNAFLDSIIEAAQGVDSEYGVPTSVAMGQATLESGWGTSRLTVNDKNYFGFKCTSSSEPGPIAIGCHAYQTTECTPGCHTVTAYFRVYRTAGDSFRDYGRLLSTSSRYQPAFAHVNNPDEFVRAVWRGGYATDPQYPNKVIKIMQDYNLYRYNI
jgi:hypothetical protein